jgi:hypothetical protein
VGARAQQPCRCRPDAVAPPPRGRPPPAAQARRRPRATGLKALARGSWCRRVRSRSGAAAARAAPRRPAGGEGARCGQGGPQQSGRRGDAEAARSGCVVGTAGGARGCVPRALLCCCKPPLGAMWAVLAALQSAPVQLHNALSPHAQPVARPSWSDAVAAAAAAAADAAAWRPPPAVQLATRGAGSGGVVLDRVCSGLRLAWVGAPT